MIQFNKPEDIKNLVFSKWAKRPIEIKAVQINEPFSVKTLEGNMEGKADDFLIIGIEQEMYPCAKSVFLKTYEVV